MNPILEPYSLFLVDMDDTLFEERDFVLSGFQAVADHLPKWGIDSQDAFAFLNDRFRSHGRDRIFNHLLLHYVKTDSEAQIRELVEIYRAHTPQIALYPGAKETLNALHGKGRIIIVTDGLAEVQRLKFEALGLPARVDDVVFCQASGYNKPDPRSVAGLVQHGDPQAVFIGDNPEHDLCMADQLGIAAIRIRSGRFKETDNTPWEPIGDFPSFVSLQNESSSSHA